MARKLTFALTLAALLPLSAEAVEFSSPRKGDWFINGLNIGPSIAINSGEGLGSTTAFTFFNDANYMLTDTMAFGAVLNFGFGSDYILFDVGPQFTYIPRSSSQHVFLFKGALPIKLQRISVGAGNFSTSSSNFGFGFQLGGGYRYYFNNLKIGRAHV